jgi:hypothetical protein
MKRMQWEKPYIQQIISALAPHGRVLQVGFGDGFAAQCLRENPLLEHVIIEKDSSHIAAAKEYALKHPKTQVIENNWQKVLKTLGEFDAIYFHDVLLKDISVMQHSQDLGKIVLSQGKKALDLAHELFPDLMKKKYSLEDLETFFQNEGKKHPEETVRFLFELYKHHQISHEIYHDFSKKHGLPIYVAKMKEEPKEVEEGHLFLIEAFHKHLKKGGRFTMFCLDPTSKYEDPKFFDEIITNPHVNYQEKLIDIQVPQDCPYYKGTQALVLVVEKVG